MMKTIATIVLFTFTALVVATPVAANEHPFAAAVDKGERKPRPKEPPPDSGEDDTRDPRPKPPPADDDTRDPRPKPPPPSTGGDPDPPAYEPRPVPGIWVDVDDFYDHYQYYVYDYYRHRPRPHHRAVRGDPLVGIYGLAAASTMVVNLMFAADVERSHEFMGGAGLALGAAGVVWSFFEDDPWHQRTLFFIGVFSATFALLNWSSDDPSEDEVPYERSAASASISFSF